MQPNLRFTLKQLQYFAAVARTGQVSLAAAECNVTQSTMTAAVADLERILDVLLFERTRNGMRLTHQGHLFLQRAQVVLEAAGEAAGDPFRERSRVQGTLELAASYTVLGYFLLPFIAKFQKLHPGAHIRLTELERSAMESAITGDQIELGVALTSNINKPKLLQRKMLARSRRQLWVATSHPLAERGQVWLEEAAPYACILPMVDEGDGSIRSYWKQAGKRPSAFIQTSSMEAVREMVALGIGVTVLSDMVFRPWSLDGRRIRQLPLLDPIPLMEVGLVWKKGQRLGPVAQALKEYLELAVGERAVL